MCWCNTLLITSILSICYLPGSVLAEPSQQEAGQIVQQDKDQRWRLAGFSVSDSDNQPDFAPLKRIRVTVLSDQLVEQLRIQAPEVEFVSDHDWTDAEDTAFDAVFLVCSRPAALEHLVRVKWIHSLSAGVEGCLPWIEKQAEPVVLTNSRGAAAAIIAEHAIAMMMSLSRGLHVFRDEQKAHHWSRGLLEQVDDVAPLTSTVAGKTLLVLGLGSIGKQIAKRGNALGMKVVATRNSSRSGPGYVDYVGLADETLSLARQADVVMNALPYTKDTEYLANQAFFKAMKNSAIYVSVGRGKTTDTNALLTALEKGQIYAAGLDVTDPEPLPKEHPLWKMKNVIITPHLAGSGGDGLHRTVRLLFENLRRYQNNEALLNLVDNKKGY